MMEKQEELPQHKKKELITKALKFHIPRIELLILAVGLGCTIWGKFIIIQRNEPPNLITQIFQVVLPDILFFAVVFLIISCLYMLKPSAWAARVALIIAPIVSTWSILDLGWLIKCGAQLQPGVLALLISDFREIWPLVQNNLRANPMLAIVLKIIIFTVLASFLWCFLRPGKVIAARIHHIKRVVILAVVIAALLSVKLITPSKSLDFTSKILGFSSHWYALVSIVSEPYDDQFFTPQSRQLPRIGEQQVTAPSYSSNELPNVVLVLLESISYAAFTDSKHKAMPYLTRMAQEGVEFQLTRIPVIRSTKAVWAVLTATTPVIKADYVEAVPMDVHYESLATLLAGVGYRSAHFEVTRGSCECAPGLYDNLGFKWAWFRENLEDTSAHLDGFAGDDCRLIQPAMEWASKEKSPFLLTLFTSVAHGPGEYNLPEGFGEPREKPYDKYIQTVKYTDYFLEQLCMALQKHNLDKNTIICILGDHGGSFRNGADNERWNPYEEAIRIPWIIRWPGHIKAGQRIDWPCSQLDVTPTLLKLIGFDISKAEFEGKDAFTPSDPNRRLYFSAWHSKSPIGFVEGNQKIVYWPYLEKMFEYDLQADPKEENPKTVSGNEMGRHKHDILNWQKESHIEVNPKQYTERLLFSHWKTRSAYRSAWTYYIP